MTGLSGSYPRDSDPSELRRALTEQARAQERAVMTFQRHLELITRTENNLAAASATIATLTVKVTELQTKIAIYAGAGSIVGGLLTALVVHFLAKR